MRAVTADHVMFNECMNMFRLIIGEKNNEDTEKNEKTGYLLMDFRINEIMDFRYFKIYPTIEVRLVGAYSAFIAPVKFFEASNTNYNEHLFVIALAAVFSFTSKRPIKAPRDGYISIQKELNDESCIKLAIQHPILTAGPGSHDTNISLTDLNEIQSNLNEIVEVLYALPDQMYENAMQSIRLVHLSHLNKREDFGLSYYLLVSAIEPIATMAVKRKKVALRHAKEEEWKMLSEENEDIKQLFSLYKEERGKSQYIGKRFVEFIIEYCPPIQWEELGHPMQNRYNFMAEISGEENDWYTKKQWFEKYPNEFDENKIREILLNLYSYRSKFTHEGKNPPHKSPESYNRFFDIETIYKEKDGEYRVEDIILPNFRLVSFIANRSIRNYLLKYIEK